MAWVRLDDGFPDHPKVVRAGDLAAWLYVCGLTYANRQGTDGFIPAAIVPRLTGLKNPLALANRLVEAGLWERSEDGGYRIHDYLEYQPSAERVRQERSTNAARQASWRGKRNAVTNAGSHAIINEGVTGAPYPIPVTSPPVVTSKAPDTFPEGGVGGTESTAEIAAAAAAPSPTEQKIAGDAARASPKPSRVGTVVDLVKASGVPIVVTPRDGSAVKTCSANPELIAEAYSAAYRGDWDPGGNGWLRENLALHAVIGRLAGYQAERNGRTNGKPNRGGGGSVRHI